MNPLNTFDVLQEELDLLGEELDEHDPVRSINGELNGEDLLRTHYTLPNNANGTFDTILSSYCTQLLCTKV